MTNPKNRNNVMTISPTARVHPEAIIGKNVQIEDFAIVDKDVVIGDGTRIGSNAILYAGTRIGRDCSIFPGAVIAGEPQDLKFKGEYSIVEIGNRTTIREYATINRGTSSKGITKIGDDCLLMAYSHIGHDSEIGNNCVISNSVQIAGEVVIEDWAIVGGMSAIHQFCRIGTHAMVSGMTGVLADVAPYTKVFGVPARYVGINLVGLRRRGFSHEQISTIHDVYRLLFQNGMNTSQALDYIRFNLPDSAEKELIMHFASHSHRGIIRTSGQEAESEQVKVERY